MPWGVKIGGAVALLAAAAWFGATHRGQLSQPDSSPAIAATPTPAGAHPIDPNKIEPTVIGMNMGVPAYYSGEWTFADPIRTFSELYTDDGHGHGDILTNQLKTDTQGHPIEVPQGAMLQINVSHPPGVRYGVYDCRISPGWKVERVFNGAVEQSGEHFRLTISPAEGKEQLVKLRMTALKPGIALIDLGCNPKGAPADRLFNPAFLADTHPFPVLRFMDWMKTNNLPPQKWAERSTPTGASQVSRGVALEYMVALANTQKADPWFNMPFDADPDYYRKFATYVRDTLAPDRKVYVEFSNEVWNPGFDQSKQATERGKKLYPSADDALAADYYYADRVRDVMKIWSDVFAGREKRLVRVVGTQAGWPDRGARILAHKDTWRSADVVAIAPYFGWVLGDEPVTGKARVDRVLGDMPGEIDKAIKNARDSKIVANRFGLPLVTYEAGPHYLGFLPQANADVTALYHDPRFYTLYKSYMEKWKRQVGGLMVLFDSTGTGLFAHSDYTGQPLSEAPKMRAAVDFAAEQGGGR